MVFSWEMNNILQEMSYRRKGLRHGKLARHLSRGGVKQPICTGLQRQHPFATDLEEHNANGGGSLRFVRRLLRRVQKSRDLCRLCCVRQSKNLNARDVD